MEMHQIRYFLEVCTTLNFTRAAKQCNVTQPALTRAIQKLEEELGGPLFRRERKLTHLTDLGHLVRPQFELILKKIAQAGADDDVVRVELLRLFFLLQSFVPAVPHPPVPPQKQQTLRHFRQLVEKNYRSLKLPKEYAVLLHITPNHLNALVTSLTGKNAGSIIRERVLLEAKRLLTNAAMSVSEIAYDLEFQDNSYFTRFFKRYTGQTPEAFRKTIYSPIL